MLPYVMTYLRSLANHEEGQDLVEYGLILALVAILAIVGLTALGTNISNVFSTIVSAFP